MRYSAQQQYLHASRSNITNRTPEEAILMKSLHVGGQQAQKLSIIVV